MIGTLRRLRGDHDQPHLTWTVNAYDIGSPVAGYVCGCDCKRCTRKGRGCICASCDVRACGMHRPLPGPGRRAPLRARLAAKMGPLRHTRLP